MIEPPVGLQALQLCQYKDPEERWGSEDWLELGDILDICSVDHDDCKCGNTVECRRLMESGITCCPTRFGYNEKANAKTRGSLNGKDKTDSWIPALTIPHFRDNVLRY